MTNSIKTFETIQGDLSLLSENKLTFPFQRFELPYELNALEPYIGGDTMDFHYNKHHKAYNDNFNNLFEKEVPAGTSILEVFKNISKYSAGLINNGGGYFNHNIFWSLLTPNSTKSPIGNLAEAINKKFGSFESFKEQFNAAAMGRFGSGWAWLSVKSNGELFISSTANQFNPLMDLTDEKGIPVLTIDVWEHAYYLNYQNRRADYVKNFWEVVNWNEAERRFNEAKQVFGL